jgi:uncharacterized protein YbjT (DUF2867 family)
MPGRSARAVFITGGTGYLGSRLVRDLVARGHAVRALVRPGSESKLPPGASAVIGDALRAETFREAVRGSDTFVQLVGVAHPSPSKAAEFTSIDLRSAEAGIEAAVAAGVGHFVYVSVAQPAPLMRAYIDARRRAEAALSASMLPATVLRPWYVLGPGHYWPILLLPLYWLAELIPSLRQGARRLGLVNHRHMSSALVRAVEGAPPRGTRVVEVHEIRQAPGLSRS